MTQRPGEVERKKVPLMLLVLSGLGFVNVGSVVTIWNLVDSIATEQYVDTAVAKLKSAQDARITDTNEQIDNLSKQLRRIRAFTELVPQIKDLIAARCMGARGLDFTIAQLKREFKDLTGEDYDDPACETLVRVPR